MSDQSPEPARRDEALAQAVRDVLSQAPRECETIGAADRARERFRRLPWFMGFAGGVLGAAASVHHGADALGTALTTGLFGVVMFLMGVRLNRRMHPNQAVPWVTTARRRALEAAVEALIRAERLGAGERLAAEDPAAQHPNEPALDFRLLAQTGATPPTPNSYLEEALAGRAGGIDYALGSADYGYQLDRGQPDLRGRLLQIDLGRSFDGAVLMTWAKGELARVGHNWFASAHRTARPGAPPGGIADVRVQRTVSANALDAAPAAFLDALGRYLSAQARPPFVLAAADRWLLLYVQGVGALSGDENSLGEALARAQSDPTAFEGPALAAAEAIAPLHRLVATLGAASPPPKA